MGRHVQFVMTPPRGLPLKSNSISMYFPFKDKRDFASTSSHQNRSVRRSCSSPHALSALSSPTRCALTNREELLLRMVLALPKAAEMRKGSEGAEGQGGALEKGSPAQSHAD